MDSKSERGRERMADAAAPKPERSGHGAAAGALEYREFPVIEPGHTMTSVTEKISNVV